MSDYDIPCTCGHHYEEHDEGQKCEVDDCQCVYYEAEEDE
jgi:hypothetical protein